jgi:hypothetical protein
MLNKTKSSGVGGGQPSKKSKGPLAKLFNSGTKEQVLDSMKSIFTGKRILLKAQDIYGCGKVPHGKEDFLFPSVDPIFDLPKFIVSIVTLYYI